MKRAIVAAAVTAFAVTAVVAQPTSVITQRKELMKTQNAQTRVGSQMLKGEQPFTSDKARAIFAAYINTTEKFGGLFPDDSKTGGETKASPKVWTDRAGFNAALAKFTQDVKANQDKTKNLDEFRAAFGAVTRNCLSCHETYRLE
jgi:cytochrome c556